MTAAETLRGDLKRIRRDPKVRTAIQRINQMIGDSK